MHLDALLQIPAGLSACRQFPLLITDPYFRDSLLAENYTSRPPMADCADNGKRDKNENENKKANEKEKRACRNQK
jgi:hypothetical protein